MISGVLTLTAIADAEYTRLHLSTDTIVVDPYNVQTEPLKIKVEQVSGVDIMPVSVYLSVQALSLNHEIAGAVIDFGLCSDAEFVIPAKDKLYATVTAVRVDAYSDIEKKKLVESRTVNVTCNREAEPMYRGDKWTADMSFRNGDYLEHVVNGNTSIYQWSSRVEGNTSKAPWDITLTTDPEYGYWLHITEKTLFAAKMLLAKGALIGSAVFDGNYTISQHGVDENGQPSTRYDLFGEQTAYGKDKFAPNVMIDWLTGKFRGKDVDIGGKVVADRGKIGTWHITDGGIVSEDFKYPDLSGNNVTGGRGNMLKSGGGLLMCPTLGGALQSSTGKLVAGIIKAEADSKLVHGVYITAHGLGAAEWDRDASVCALKLDARNDNPRPDEWASAIDVVNGHSSFKGMSTHLIWADGSIEVTGEISAVAVNADLTISGRNLKDGHILRVINTADRDIMLSGAVTGNEYARCVKQGCSRTLILAYNHFRPESDSK